MKKYIEDVTLAGELVTDPISISLGIAGPVRDAAVRMTNRGWDISAKQLKSVFGFKSINLMNDFIAVAKSIEHLKGSDLHQVGQGKDLGGNVAVIGPGTGLGLAQIVRQESGNVYIPGEIEDTDMFFTGNGSEKDVLNIIEGHFDKPVMNDIITGRGLKVLYTAVCINAGQVVRKNITPAQVTQMALEDDPMARETLNMYWSFLGRVSGNIASIYNATGGLSADIAPSLKLQAA